MTPLFYKLFLDDERNPFKVTWAKGHFPGPWVVVRNYAQFVAEVSQRGLPAYVSFDHDLAHEHYRQSMFNPDKHYSNYYTDGTFKEKTGHECAKWLIDYCIDHNLDFPDYQVHSLNPIGRENIISLIESFRETRTLTPGEWCKKYGIEIIDPDGWRTDGTSFDTPITRKDFLSRMSVSTIKSRTQ